MPLKRSHAKSLQFVIIIKLNLFQSVLESLPGVDPQSDAMRQAMGALTGSAKKDEPKDEKKNDDKDKKQNEGESVDLATKP